MSLKIAICDDDGDAAQALRQMLRDCLAAKGMDASIRAYPSGEAFLRDAQPYDILFMDVYMPGVSGVELVRQTGASREHPVVFVTTSRDFAVEAFALHAAHYLVKPLTPDKVAEALERCLPAVGAQRVLRVRAGRDDVPIALDNVNYVEVHDKVLLIHTSLGDVETYSSLDSLFEQMNDERFMKAQRSFVVNMGYVETFLYDRLLLRNGVEITLSRANRAELKAQYQRYLFRLARGCDA